MGGLFENEKSQEVFFCFLEKRVISRVRKHVAHYILAYSKNVCKCTPERGVPLVWLCKEFLSVIELKHLKTKEFFHVRKR